MGRDQGLSPTTTSSVAAFGACTSVLISGRACGLLLCCLPLSWLLIVYIGSLVALAVTSLYHYETDPTGLVQKLTTSPSTRTSTAASTSAVYRDVRLRTIGAAVTVTVIDLVVALPVAFYMAKIAGRGLRRVLVVAVTMPLWAGYLVKGYAWRSILDPGRRRAARGVRALARLRAARERSSRSSYLWLPYMVIPIYAGLERLPNSLLEASTDLGRQGGPHVRARRAAAAPAVDRRRFDLHVRADARRLLHGADRRRHHPVHRQHHLPRVQCQPAVRGGVRHRCRS